MRILLAFLVFGLVLSNAPENGLFAAEVQGTAYPCRVQLVGAGRSQGKGLGAHGAVKVEFWTMPDCNGGYCGSAYFMSTNAWLLPSGTAQTYALNKEEILEQYQAVANAANAGSRVWWAMDGGNGVPFIYELKVTTSEGAALCKNKAYSEGEFSAGD